MRDEIVEVLVKCKTKIGLSILRVLCFVLCGLGVILTTQFGTWMFVIAILFGVAGYFAGSYSQVEYEYTYCDKEIDIDAIYSQSRRKSIMTIDLDKMEAIVGLKSSKYGEYSHRQCVVRDFTSHDRTHEDKVYAIYYDGGLKILIEPGDRLLNAISYISPRKIFKN